MGAIKSLRLHERSEPEDPRSNPSHIYVRFVFEDYFDDEPAILDITPDAQWFEFEDYSLADLLAVEQTAEYMWIDWMFRKGIAPGQEFVMRIGRPEYYQDYWGECDLEFGEATLISKQTMEYGVAALAWVGWWADINVHILATVSGRDGLQYLERRTDAPSQREDGTKDGGT